MKLERLEGKRVVITGAGRGLGRQMARDFAEHGSTVFLSSRTEAEIEQTAKSISESGGTAYFGTADVGVGTDVERMIATARETMGGIDLLINNAGSFPVGPVVEMSEEEWDHSMRVDLKSFFLCSKAAATTGGMLEARSGHVINIASVSVRRHIPNLAVHCSFKAGVLALSESFRREVSSQGIRVSIVCPGTIDTGLVSDPVKSAYVHSPDKRLPPSEVSELVLFVASRGEHINLSETAIIGA